MKKPTKGSRVSEPAIARKNMDMDVSKLDEVRELLGARTDTEAVDRALDYVLFQGQVFSALDRLADAGGVADVFSQPRTRKSSGS